MNAVLIAVLIMLVLSLLRVNVVIALLVGALSGGLIAGLSLTDTLTAITEGLGGGATIALSYALLGGFAVAISRTGLPLWLVDKLVDSANQNKSGNFGTIKWFLLAAILLMSIASQNIIPIHIAFIPLLIPPLLPLFNKMKIDRRLIASILTFGLTAPYILLPYGFGAIFHDIIATQMEAAGMTIDRSDIPTAMLIPTAGLVVGLIVAVFISYRKARDYNETVAVEVERVKVTPMTILFTILALAAALAGQLLTESMIVGALAGIAVLFATRAVRWSESDRVLIEGMQMMAFIGFVMIAANGFASVMTATGDVETLVEGTTSAIGNNQALAALLMLVVGLVVTLGIGSSFATIPIITTLFVPFAMEVGFGPMAIIALIGTAGALGDAGSPASDSTLGPTSGLNADGQHNHIWDTTVPTFIHYNIPLIIFGWIAAMVL
ncbi:sodium:proton antiporter [Chryseomicrobium excrementi]|uniref:Sodium:proton antiporter n=1 Tax=Chryseomicrobium excrementi TaxID=2041346 RepID=A0A2M9EYU2_9BACL|nr:Na+/H+ antiporter NhaC family protein [Chryseomicrobium excrementi]PJK16377.1 sodium:proton antiporter [Chryseomicrobium excrementi]